MNEITIRASSNESENPSAAFLDFDLEPALSRLGRGLALLFIGQIPYDVHSSKKMSFSPDRGSFSLKKGCEPVHLGHVAPLSLCMKNAVYSTSSAPSSPTSYTRGFNQIQLYTCPQIPAVVGESTWVKLLQSLKENCLPMVLIFVLVSPNAIPSQA